MSYGALSEEAKVALATGAEMAGTGICSGEGGMLPEEQAANSRYFYELASGRFGWDLDKVKNVQHSTSRPGKVPKRGRVVICRETKSGAKLPRYAGCKKANQQLAPPPFPISLAYRIISGLPLKYARHRAAFPLVSSCQPSISKRISTLR